MVWGNHLVGGVKDVKDVRLCLYLWSDGKLASSKKKTASGMCLFGIFPLGTNGILIWHYFLIGQLDSGFVFVVNLDSGTIKII